MQIVLENYGALVAHVESLSQTNSQAQKRSELKGYYQRWTDASIPVHMAIYLDVLSPLRCLSLGFQRELHDTVKAVHCIQEFTNNGQIKASDKINLLILLKPYLLTSTNFCQILKNGIMLARLETNRASVCNHYTQ